jgi:hypothetical protein
MSSSSVGSSRVSNFSHPNATNAMASINHPTDIRQRMPTPPQIGPENIVVSVGAAFGSVKRDGGFLLGRAKRVIICRDFVLPRIEPIRTSGDAWLIPDSPAVTA